MSNLIVAPPKGPCHCVICTAEPTNTQCPYTEDCDADIRANEVRLSLQEAEDEAWELHELSWALGEFDSIP
jgi:hypothetical protein